MNLSSINFKTSLPSKKQYFNLFESIGWNNTYKLTQEKLMQTIKNSSFYISAFHEEKLVGFGRILSDGIAHAVLFDVIVLPDYQRNGIGSEIMVKLLAECKRLNIRDIQLFCAKGKIKFYEKLGFKQRPDDAPGMEIRNLK